MPQSTCYCAQRFPNTLANLHAMPMIVLCSHREGNDIIHRLCAASGIYETLEALHIGG